MKQAILKFILFISLLAGILLASYWSFNRTTYSQPAQDGETAKVKRIVDGDTIAVELNGKDETVRFIGMNTAETSVSGIPNECYGPEATTRTKQLLDGMTVKLTRDPNQPDRDKYGRLLRYVYLDGDNINLMLIREGFAYDWTDRYKSVFKDQFHNAEQDAMANKYGLWGKCY